MKYGIALSLIVFDIVTGTLKAIKGKTWTSKNMREGGFHKMSIILFICLAVICDYGQTFLDLGFQLPIVNLVLIYVCTMEIGSSCENLISINPALQTIIKKVFKKGVNE